MLDRRRDDRVRGDGRQALDRLRKGDHDPLHIDPRRPHLEALAEALAIVGDVDTEFVDASRSGPAFLRVVNPNSTNLAEDIQCDLGDGAWWFCWSWGDRIGLTADVHGAAKAIRHVLMVRTAASRGR